MNWNYWLPWREYHREDSTYESRVKERCDHNFEVTTTLQPRFDTYETRVEDGHLLVPEYELVEEYCTKCGVPGLEGVAQESSPDSIWEYTGERHHIAHYLAFSPEFTLDPDLSVEDALVEPVESDADYVVDEEGETTVSTNGDGRVLVNEAERYQTDG